MSKRVVLITGGTGLIGQEISEILARNGFQVHILTRNPEQKLPEGIHNFMWDVKNKSIDTACFNEVNYAIHLAGASIAKRWTSSYKKVIIDSRVETANFLFEEMQKANVKLQCFVGASASGYYIKNSGEILIEESPPGVSFLSEVCQKWEKASQQFQAISERVVINRIGVVLSEKGGALEKMLPPFSFNLAPYFGSGKQYYPCVHVTDVANQFVYSIINKKLKGVYNACTEAITQKQLNAKIAKAKGKSVINIPAPKPVLQLMLGDMSQIITESWQMSGERIRSMGFSPQYGTIDEALAAIFEPEPKEEETK